MIEGVKRNCGGCGDPHYVYGPFVTKRVYRCLKCESRESMLQGLAAKSAAKPRLDEIERRMTSEPEVKS